MKRILALSLLFALLAVPASAEKYTEAEWEKAKSEVKFHMYAIQSCGWKCDRTQSFDYGEFDVISDNSERTHVYRASKITCENNLIYFMRETGKIPDRVVTFCHKGTCKKFQ